MRSANATLHGNLQHLNSMQFLFRLIAIALSLGLFPSSLWATASDWDCSQPGADKDWVCGSKKPLSKKTAEQTEKTPAKPDILSTEDPEQRAEDEALMAKDRLAASKLKAEEASGLSDYVQAELKNQELAKKNKQKQSRQSGWTCSAEDAEGGNDGWKCALKGRDPRGVAHQVANDGQEEDVAVNWVDSPNITKEDEWRFDHMMTVLPANPWKRACAGPRVGMSQHSPAPLKEFILSDQERVARDKAPMEIDSDGFELIDGEVANFSGAAEMVRADQKLWADFVTRNLKTNTINANGNVVYMEKGFALSSDTAFIEGGGSGRSVYRNSQFILPAQPARGTSRLTYMDSSTLSRYETFTYTGCPTGNQDWVMHATNAKVNKDTGQGSASNAWLEFKGVPFFYTPYMTFATDGRRQSGFLSPSIGYTGQSGINAWMPYYFNLAPNFDYTATPGFYNKRGFVLRNEFRYMTDMSRGMVFGDIVPMDQETHTTRGKFSFVNDTRFSENLNSSINVNWLSDYNYQANFGGPLGMNSSTWVPSQATLNYSDQDVGNFSLMANNFQNLNPTIPDNQQAYAYAPMLSYNKGGAVADTGLQYNMVSNVANIRTNGSQMTTADRIVIRPNISYPMEASYGYIKPKATLAFNQYYLSEQQYWMATQPTGTTNGQSSQNFTIPILSVDSGTFLESDTSIGGHPLVSTIEPRLFYVYIPYVNQYNIPAYDSTTYDTTYYQLFRENAFTGWDRISNANNLTTAVTTKLIDPSNGLERFRFTFGNQAFFNPNQVTLSGSPTALSSQSHSNLIGDIATALSNDWSIYGGGQYNVPYSSVERAQAGLLYNNRKNQLMNIAYRYRLSQNTGQPCPLNNPNSDCLNLVDTSFRLPILGNWYAIGRWEYSMLNQITLDSFLGLETENCCWRFALIGRHYLNSITSPTATSTTVTGSATNTVFLQLELKGLAVLGDQVDQFLERTITGYRYSGY